MERLKTATAKTLAETLICFSFDLISLLGEYADELRFSHSIVLKRPLSAPCQTGVILNEHGRALFHCGKTLEDDDDGVFFPRYHYTPFHGSLEIKQIAYHNHSGTLFLFASAPHSKSVIYQYPSLSDMKAAPRIVHIWTGKSSWDKKTMGICTDNLFDKEKCLIYASNQEELHIYDKQGQGSKQFLYINTREDVIHMAKTKQEDIVFCTNNEIIKFNVERTKHPLFICIRFPNKPICVAVDSQDKLYILINNQPDGKKKIRIFSADGMFLQTMECSPNAVWMQFIYDQLFVFQSNGMRDVYQ